MSHLLGALFQVMITILLIKLYNDLFVKKNANSRTKPNSWNDASTAIEKLENRLREVQSREIAWQERVWILEDENRLLKTHLQQLRTITPHNEPEPEDDDPREV